MEGESIKHWIGGWIGPGASLDILEFIHLAVCLTTGPKPLPKRAVHIVRSKASYFKWEYPLLFLRSSSSFQRLLPRLPVTSIPPFIFPSITRCRRQLVRKMWPIQFAFRLRHCPTKKKLAPIAHWNYYIPRPSLLFDVTQCRLVVTYRRFGSTYRSHLQASTLNLKMRPIGCPETCVSN